MQLNPRSQWQGVVKAIKHGNIVSKVTLEMSPNILVTAIVSKISVEAQGLQVGGKAYALINSTEVALAVDQRANPASH